MEYRYIQQADELVRYLTSLENKGISEIALDIEAEFNLHSYGEKLCLIQIYDGEIPVIIDPFRLSNEHLDMIFGNRNLVKIMYGATSDQALIYKKHQILVKTIIDLMPAVELLEFEKKNLSAVLAQVFNLKMMNKKKFQMYNWQQRPLKSDAIEYSISDVFHLFKLKDHLYKELINKDLMGDYIVENLKTQNKEQVLKSIPGIFKKNEYKKMKTTYKNIFTEYYNVREGFAEKLDLPPNSVFTNRQLFDLAQEYIHVNEIMFSKRVPQKIYNEIHNALNKVNN